MHAHPHSVPQASLAGFKCTMGPFFPLKSKYDKITMNNCNTNGDLRGLKSYSQLVSFLDSFYILTRIL